jgi:hypothetical protein
MSFLAIRGIAIAVMLAGTAWAQDDRTVAPGGRTQIATGDGRSRAVAEVQTVRLEPSDKAYPRPADGTARPVVVVAALRLTVANEEVVVARSVFADLLDPVTVRFKEASAPFVLAVACGDGADATIVEIAFDGTGVRSRRVFSAIDARRPIQETTYRTLVLQ